MPTTWTAFVLAATLLFPSLTYAQQAPRKAPAAVPDPRLELAQRPLSGPRFELTLGLLGLALGPAIGMSMAAGEGLKGGLHCGLMDEPEREACETRSERRQKQKETKALVFGLSITLVGLLFLIDGGRRIHEIREAQRELGIIDAQLRLGPSHGELSLKVAF